MNVRALEAQDEFVQLKAAQILTIFLSTEKVIQPQHLKPFLEILAGFVQGSAPHKRDVAVQCLEVLLPKPEARAAVWNIGGIIAGCALFHDKIWPILTHATQARRDTEV